MFRPTLPSYCHKLILCIDVPTFPNNHRRCRTFRNKSPINIGNVEHLIPNYMCIEDSNVCSRKQWSSCWTAHPQDQSVWFVFFYLYTYITKRLPCMFASGVVSQKVWFLNVYLYIVLLSLFAKRLNQYVWCNVQNFVFVVYWDLSRVFICFETSGLTQAAIPPPMSSPSVPPSLLLSKVKLWNLWEKHNETKL